MVAGPTSEAPWDPIIKAAHAAAAAYAFSVFSQTANMPALYLSALLLICLTPGPNVFLSVSCGLQRGVATVGRAVAGIMLASSIFLALSALGVAALLNTSPTLVTLIRGLGALYLIYLGIRLLLVTANTERPVRSVAIGASPLLQGFITHLSNPKAILFWTSILPQFIDTRQPLLEQTLRLGLVGMAIDAVILFGYGAAAAVLRERFMAGNLARWMDRVAGVFFLLIGAWLLLSLAQ